MNTENLVTFTAEERARLGELVKIRTHRLEDIAEPETWASLTRHMESGERRQFEQACRDDELTIKALEYVLQVKRRQRGRWVQDLSYPPGQKLKFICSRCKRWVYVKARGGNGITWMRYCPNCGAKMSQKDLTRPETEAEANGPV